MKYYDDVTRKMERTLHDVRRWIRSHYTNADNTPLMLHILQIYADPLVLALQSIETSSEWMKHDVRELQRSLKLPWTELIDPPPRTMTAAQMEKRMRDAVKRTHDIWIHQMHQWVKEFGDDSDGFEVEEADVRALRRMTEVFTTLMVLKSETIVRKTMGIVIDAAIARRDRKEERRQQHVARRLAEIRAQNASTQRELQARRAAAQQQGLRVGMGKRSREHVPMGMLAPRAKK
jgi:hypothetical protein